METVRPDGSLFFCNAHRIKEAVHDLVTLADPERRKWAVDFGAAAAVTPDELKDAIADFTGGFGFGFGFDHVICGRPPAYRPPRGGEVRAPAEEPARTASETRAVWGAPPHQGHRATHPTDRPALWASNRVTDSDSGPHTPSRPASSAKMSWASSTPRAMNEPVNRRHWRDSASTRTGPEHDRRAGRPASAS